MDKNYADEGFIIEDGMLLAYRGNNPNVIIPDCVKIIGTHSLGYQVVKVFFPATVEKMEPVPFTSAFRLEEIAVAEDNPYYYSQDNCLIERATKTIIKGTHLSVIPQDGSVTAIASFAFQDVDCTNLYIRKCITVIESCAFGGNSDLTLLIEAESKPEGWADDWDDGTGETWDEVWWECGPGLLLEWGVKFTDDE